MRNQHLQPEENSASALDRLRTDAEGQTDLAPSTLGHEEAHPGRVYQQSHAEEGTTLSLTDRTLTEDEAMLDRLIRQAHKQRRWRQIFAGSYYTGIALYIALTLFGQLYRIPGLFSLLFVGGYASALVAEIMMRIRWSRSTANIAKIDDIRVVGALAEATEIPDKGMTSQAKEALTRLLPRLEPADAHLINDSQRRCLYRRLKIEYALTSPDYLVALLGAMEKIGDTAALPAVQELATSTVTTANGSRVKAAAQKCLPVLRARIRTRETSSTLLRASSAEETPGSALLRPVHGGTETAPEQLLRASDSDPEPH